LGGSSPPDIHVAVRRTAAVPRTPFILLVLGLLGGGLVCLLVINTTLATATFQINNLQQRNVTLSQQEQALQQQVADEQAPARIEQRARQLGMRPQRELRFLNARTGRLYSPGRVSGLINVPPGYVP
jgi:cell division protein FtsL